MTYYTGDGKAVEFNHGHKVTPAERRHELVRHALTQIMRIETCNGAIEAQKEDLWLSRKLRALEETIREIGGAE